ncbi:YagK/YfjJ domain-containing protein [Escherichia coli]|uniref:YagK/YfjJ domain-containing protein n=2 Tax=Escherichia coli TaxID=562 RepID=UPI002795EFDB|nr:inovirus-type Gp2 protein [Escherichia coli]
MSMLFISAHGLIIFHAYWHFLIRLAYLAKTRTKDVQSGYRNFGVSQCPRLGGLAC